MERRRHKLVHPYVDEVSVVWGLGAYANWPDTVEIAFLRDGKFYEEPIAPFEEEYSIPGIRSRSYGKTVAVFSRV